MSKTTVNPEGQDRIFLVNVEQNSIILYNIFRNLFRKSVKVLGNTGMNEDHYCLQQINGSLMSV